MTLCAHLFSGEAPEWSGVHRARGCFANENATGAPKGRGRGAAHVVSTTIHIYLYILDQLTVPFFPLKVTEEILPDLVLHDGLDADVPMEPVADGPMEPVADAPMEPVAEAPMEPEADVLVEPAEAAPQPLEEPAPAEGRELMQQEESHWAL